MKLTLLNSNYMRAWGANFMLFFSFMLIVPLLPIYLEEQFGASKDMIGVVLSGYVAVAMLTRACSGIVVDTFDRKNVLLLSYIVMMAFFAGYIFAGHLLLFAIVRTLHGAPFGMTTVANSTVAIDVLPSERRTEGIGYYGLSNNVATAISPTVGLWLYNTWHDFDYLFMASMFTAFLGVWCVSGIKSPESYSRRDGANGTKEPNNPNEKSRIFSLDRFFTIEGWPEGLAMTGFGCAYGVVSTYVAIYGRDELGITGGTGAFFGLLSISLIASRLTGSRSLRKGRIVENAVLGCTISFFGYLAFAALHNEWGYYGCALLLGLGNGHLWPAFQSIFIGLVPNSRRGTANASLLTTWDLGIGLGIVAGGFFAEHLGYHSAFWYGFTMQALSVLFVWIYIRTHRKNSELTNR